MDSGVHGKTGFIKHLSKGDDLSLIFNNTAAGRTCIDGADTTDAKHRDIGRGTQRQNVVLVFQQDGTLGDHRAIKVIAVRNKVFRAGKIRRIIGGVLGFTGFHQFGRAGAKH